MTERPPIGTPVRVTAFVDSRGSRDRETLTGTVTRWVGDHTIEVSGPGWSGLYAPEGVVVVERER